MGATRGQLRHRTVLRRQARLGSDPSLFTTRAVRDGDSWVIDGEKWFSLNFERAAFIIVMAVTSPDVSVYRGTSMFLIPAGTPGLEIIRRTGYEVLYNLRLAVLIEGSYQRSVRDPARSERRDLGDRVLSNMARAVDLVSSES
jgi:hypothetical protein